MGAVSSSHNYDHEESYSVVEDSGFSIPNYDSQTELLTQLVAPFFLISLLLKIGFDRALRFIYADDDNTVLDLTQNRSPPGTGRKSTLMSLAVTGMLVPSPFFTYINELVAWVFGGMMYVLGVLIAVYFFYLIVTNLW